MIFAGIRDDPQFGDHHGVFHVARCVQTYLEISLPVRA